MAKIAVVGPRESVLCYLAAGFSVYVAESGDGAPLQIDLAVKEGAAVVFVSPEYAADITDSMKKYAYSPDVAVTLLPKRTDGMDPGTRLMKSAVERAVGADIIYRD